MHLQGRRRARRHSIGADRRCAGAARLTNYDHFAFSDAGDEIILQHMTNVNGTKAVTRCAPPPWALRLCVPAAWVSSRAEGGTEQARRHVAPRPQAAPCAAPGRYSKSMIKKRANGKFGQDPRVRRPLPDWSN